MGTVSVRELRNHGGRVLQRVARGETLTVTMDGKPIAELRPLKGRGLSPDELRRRLKGLPAVDAAKLRADIDRLFDTSL
jgi:prevent-host-death family protein